MSIHVSIRTAFVVALATAGMAGQTANGTDLFIAGTIGEIYVGDSRTGGFEHFGGVCLAPVRALAIAGDAIYAGDMGGGVISVDIETGDFLDVFWVPDAVTAMVVHGEDLLISDPQGRIRRVEPSTGIVESTLESPIPIEAMALDGDDLFIAGPAGAVWKGDATTGDFELFAAACLGPIYGLALDDRNIYAGDETGAILRFDLATGKFRNRIDLPAGVVAMIMDDELLVSDAARNIRRVHPMDGEILATLESPIDVQAMVLDLCGADIDGNGVVDFGDILEILAAWGNAGGPEDLDGSGIVDFGDLLVVLGAWGPCP